MSDPKYDLDKAMASPYAREAIRLLLDGVALRGSDCHNLRQAARVLTVAEADRAYVDGLRDRGVVGGPMSSVCRAARKREKEGKAVSDTAYDLDAAMASTHARKVMHFLLHGFDLYESDYNKLRQAARIPTVAEADRVYVDWLLGSEVVASPEADACLEARRRERGWAK